MDSLQKQKIVWNLINSALAGALVFFGAFMNGGITWEGVGVAFAASAVVAIVKFRDFWTTQEGEYCHAKTFNFI